MSRWTYLINPLAPLRGEGEARAAAGASSVALVISGAMSAVGAVLMSQHVDAMRMAASEEARRFAEQSPQTSAILQGMVENGMVEMGVVIVAAWAVLQVLAAALHWRRPGSFIPIVFLVLLVYRLGDRLLELVLKPAEASAWTLIGVPLLALCILLHAVALRGVSRMAQLRREA
ncbi:MAG TPA: hypothetical protein VGR32_08605 [Brevundimonas sp.]|jgi:hypothetical protein|uniref:hypothetical protein n=1 Tax=Brevundimonas sp. TaxID=1871086 RepID=UPI002DF4F34C|nr:hypothetical protein [Brevundimonas sp.]